MLNKFELFLIYKFFCNFEFAGDYQENMNCFVGRFVKQVESGRAIIAHLRTLSISQKTVRAIPTKIYQ